MKNCEIVWGFDDEKNDRYIEVRITYEFVPASFESNERGAYIDPGTLYVDRVEVLFVQYYNPAGEIVADLRR